MDDATTDEDVLAAAAAGDGSRREDAFVELVNRYERRIYAICYRFFGNHADAQDATQDTFIAVVRRAGQFRGDSKVSTWLYRIAVNACKDRARARDRRPQTPVVDVGETAAAAGLDLAGGDEHAGAELAIEVQHALDQLDELSRTLIILCSIEGRDYAEVAATLDLPVGTVKSRVFRARAKLAELLAPVLDANHDHDPLPPRAARDLAGPTSATTPPAGGPRAPPG